MFVHANNKITLILISILIILIDLFYTHFIFSPFIFLLGGLIYLRKNNKKRNYIILFYILVSQILSIILIGKLINNELDNINNAIAKEIRDYKLNNGVYPNPSQIRNYSFIEKNPSDYSYNYMGYRINYSAPVDENKTPYDIKLTSYGFLNVKKVFNVEKNKVEKTEYFLD